MTVVEISQLDQTLGGKRVLKEISLRIGQGECVALIGPNGAGKTTLMSILLGDRPFDKGQIRIFGQKVGASILKTKVAVLPQENVIPEQFKVKELLAFKRAIYKEPIEMERIQSYLDFSPDQYNMLSGKLSGGQRRLLSFVLSLVGRPSLLFLDEPTAGMDTATRLRFWEIVADLKETGMSIIYSSHYIEEVEKVADRLLVLHKGALVKDTTPFALKQEEQIKHLLLPLSCKDVVKGLDFVHVLGQKKDVLECETADPDELWQVLSAAGLSLREVEIRNRSLLDKIFEEGEAK